MSDATPTDRSGREYGGGAPASDTGRPNPVDGPVRRAFQQRPLEYSLRLAAGGIGLSLIALTLSRLTSPPFAGEAMALLYSPTVQWLLVAVFAIVLVAAAVGSGSDGR